MSAMPEMRRDTTTLSLLDGPSTTIEGSVGQIERKEKTESELCFVIRAR